MEETLNNNGNPTTTESDYNVAKETLETYKQRIATLETQAGELRSEVLKQDAENLHLKSTITTLETKIKALENMLNVRDPVMKAEENINDIFENMPDKPFNDIA